MTTPKRPSLADTLARIAAAIADHAAKLDAQPPCLRCARKSLIDSPFCAYHLPCPIDQGPTLVCPTCGKRGRGRTIRDVGEDPQCVDCLRGLQLDVRPRGGITENGHVLPWSPYLQPALDEAARQSAAQLAATVKRTNAKATAPPVPEPAWGWFGRLLNRLIP